VSDRAGLEVAPHRLPCSERQRLQVYVTEARGGTAAAPHHCGTVWGATSQPRAGARRPQPSARHASTRTLSSPAPGWPGPSVPGGAGPSPAPAVPWPGRQGPPWGWPVARRWPRPRPPRERPPVGGQPGGAGSTVRGWRRGRGRGRGSGAPEAPRGEARLRAHSGPKGAAWAGPQTLWGPWSAGVGGAVLARSAGAGRRRSVPANRAAGRALPER
jgi:hypothetical protein